MTTITEYTETRTMTAPAWSKSPAREITATYHRITGTVSEIRATRDGHLVILSDGTALWATVTHESIRAIEVGQEIATTESKPATGDADYTLGRVAA